jgi:hypothetical protein
MWDWRTISDIELRVELAKEYGRRDILTSITWGLAKSLAVVTMLLFPLEIVTTAVGGCLLALTFDLLLIPLTIIWLPLWALLLGTSWLWLKAWYLRPILLLPGVLVSFVADIFVTLAPETERAAKWAKLAIANEWPLSWLLVRPPEEYDILAEAQDDETKEPLFEPTMPERGQSIQLDEEEIGWIERQTGYVVKELSWPVPLFEPEMEMEKLALASAALINLARFRIDRGDLRGAASTAWKAYLPAVGEAHRVLALLVAAEAHARYGDARQAKSLVRSARDMGHDLGLRGEEWYKLVRPIRQLLVPASSRQPA